MSSSMYGIVRTVHQPTAVDDCCSCKFFNNQEENLVVACANWLKVYRVVAGEASPSDTSSVGSKQKLECVVSYHLFGNIVSVSALCLPWKARDIILLSFKDAKLSVVEYDPHTRDIVTLSLHYFEEDDLKSGLYSNFKKPVVRIDPDLRCAAMLVYGCQLIIFPFKKDAAADGSAVSKSPFAPSYIIDLSKMEEKIHNVVDMQFLQGYYEPTLFILYEPIRTWVGRLPTRKDTCRLATLSLNMQEKVHPVIWSLDNLPYDCQKALPLPKPTGGVLVFTVSSVIYLNQNVPPYAVSLLNAGDHVTNFPMKAQESVAIMLDNSHVCLLSSNQAVISTKSGEIYVMTLCLDNTRAVRNFHFDKAASSVLPSCLCLIGEGSLFLGSRLGNSLLLKYQTTDSSETAAQTTQDVEEKKEQKLHSDQHQDWLAKDAAVLENELEELEVYGSSESAERKDEIPQYNFQVCDSLMNVAPCARISLGEPAFLSEELVPLCQMDLDLELVTTSGYGKNGALTFLQRTIRPQIVTTFQLPDIRNVWTVKGPLNSDTVDENQANCLDKDMESYLILGKDNSTMVLQTTDDISELDQSGFNTETRTVFAGNIGDNYTVQVTAKGIRLLLGVKQLQNIPVDMGSSLSTAIVCDLYLLVVSELGALMLLQLKVTADDLDPRLTVIRQPADLELEAVTACLHKDVSGLFTFPSEVTEETTGSTVSATPLAARRASRHSTSMTEDSHISFTSQEEIDEDELLYGDSEINVTLPDDSNNTAAKDAADMESADLDTAWSTSENTRTTHDPTYWAFITTQDHKLQIYSVPEFTLAYEVKNFNGGHVVLSNSEVEDGGKEPDAKNLPAVKELLITALGPKKHKTYMFARTTAGVLLIYEAFSYKERPTRDRLEMRFSRLQHNVIVRERKRVAKKRNAEGGVDEGKITYSTKLLHSFENIGGYSGVFLTGAYPHWFILSRKGELRCHPMGIDKGIVCMSNFHNINSPRGFLYFNTQDELRISILPAHLAYEHQWPSRKVPLKTTAHFILYDPESKVYIVVCSKTEVCKKFVRIENDEKQYVEMEKDERFVYPTQENYYIQLLSPINCDFIPGTRINAEEGESITAMEIVSLNTDHQMKTIVSIGTSYCYNEEVTARGKITLYEIIEVVPEPGQPLTKNKLKEIYSKDQKGPVTAVTHVEGMLIAAIGQKIYVFELKDGELCGASFIDTQLYIHQMVSIKNLILIADIQMSVSVLRYQPDHRVLSVVSRDLKPMETYGVEFAVDNTNLGFLATDREQNLSIFLYQPDDIVSSGGTILIKKADINIGTCVNSLCRVRCKLNDPTTVRQFSGIVEKRHVTYYASVDGAVGYLLPLTERVYRRLDMTQKLLYTTIQHTAGLNPMTFRSVKSQNKMLQNAQHNLIDGDLVWKFLGLSLTDQATIAERMGSTTDQIIEDMLEIDRITTHF